MARSKPLCKLVGKRTGSVRACAQPKANTPFVVQANPASQARSRFEMSAQPRSIAVAVADQHQWRRGRLGHESPGCCECAGRSAHQLVRFWATQPAGSRARGCRPLAGSLCATSRLQFECVGRRGKGDRLFTGRIESIGDEGEQRMIPASHMGFFGRHAPPYKRCRAGFRRRSRCCDRGRPASNSSMGPRGWLLGPISAISPRAMWACLVHAVRA